MNLRRLIPLITASWIVLSATRLHGAVTVEIGSVYSVECNCPVFISVFRHGDPNIAFTFKFTTKRIRIVRLGDTREPASATVSTRDVTARAGADYSSVHTAVAFAPLEQEKLVDIAITDDGMPEPEET